MNPFDDQNPFTKKYPTRFYARTWLYWAGVLVFVPFTIFPLILIITEGTPDKEEMIAAIIGISIFMVCLIACAFQVYARQRPILKIHKEGLWIRSIGVPIKYNVFVGCLLGYFVIFLIAFILVWQLITLQLFRIRIVRLKWENITEWQANKGTFTRKEQFLIGGWYEKDYHDFEQEFALEPYWGSYESGDFGMAIGKVSEAILFYMHNPDARETLPSWQDDEFTFGNVTFDFDV
jgi:hypothetical protein